MEIVNKKLFIIAAIIIILAAFFRFININSEEVMTDEGNYALRGIGWNDFMQSTTLTTPWNWFEEKDTLPFWTQLSFFDHPPLHFAAIWLSTKIFGVHLWSIRLFPAIFGILSVMLIMAIFIRRKLIYGAICSGLFLAVSPWHILISRRAAQESMVIFFLLLCTYIVLRILEDKADKKYIWIIMGLILGLGLLTKYSMAVIFPTIIYLAMYKKWYKNKFFYLMPLIFFITMIPLILYNIFTYLERKHFDLQITRFLKMDTLIDWPASVQGIWQGNVHSVITYFQNATSWISIFAMATIIIGFMYFICKKIEKENFAICAFSYSMIILTGIFSALTLGDFGRSSIIIPFLALGFGMGSEAIILRKNTIFLMLIFACFILLSFSSISDRLGKSYLPKFFIFSFYEQPHGFDYYEKWKEKHFSISYSPIHYLSLKNWFEHQMHLVNTTKGPIIIYDQRIIWFGANWYFYKDTFYSDNIPVMHMGIVELLLRANAIDVEGKKIYFVEADDAAMDAKPGLDPTALSIYKNLKQMANAQNVQPVIIQNDSGENVLKIWEFIWKNSDN